jgi:hypothetical protein
MSDPRSFCALRVHAFERNELYLRVSDIPRYVTQTAVAMYAFLMPQSKCLCEICESRRHGSSQ